MSPGLWTPGLDRLSGRTTSTGAPAALGLWPLSWPGQQLFRWTKAPPPRPPHPALQKQKVGAQQSVGWRPVGSHLYERPRTGRPWEAVPAGSLSVFSRLRCGSRGSAPAWPVVQGQAGVRPLTRTSAPGCPPPPPAAPRRVGVSLSGRVLGFLCTSAPQLPACAALCGPRCLVFLFSSRTKM